MISRDQYFHSLEAKIALVIPQVSTSRIQRRGVAWNTTTERLSVSDGRVWDDVAYRDEIIQNEFDAVVSADGSEDYTLLSSAITDGKRRIFIKSGSYTETSPINISNNVKIVGQDASSVVITFEGLTTPAIFIDGNGGVVEKTGTISITSGTTIVSGIGTTFTNILPGANILIGSCVYQIASIQSDDALTIATPYIGASITNSVFFSQTTTVNFSHIEGICLQNSATTPCSSNALRMRGTSFAQVKGCIFFGFSGNILVENSCLVTIQNCISRDSITFGSRFYECFNLLVVGCAISNNTGTGVELNGDVGCLNVNVSDCVLSGNNGNAINIAGICQTIEILGCVMERNISDAITTSVDTSKIFIGSCNISRNSATGVFMGGYVNEIGGCIISENGGSGVTIQTGCVVTGSLIYENVQDGILIDPQDGEISITSNTIRGNGGHGVSAFNTIGKISLNGNTIVGSGGRGLYIKGTSNQISGNTIYSNGLEGIYAEGGNTITGNSIYENNGGLNINGGSNTITGNNIHTNTGDGIIVGSNDYNTICANNIYDNTGNGIAFDQNAQNNNVVSNNIRGNTLWGILVEKNNTEYIIIDANHVFENSGGGLNVDSPNCIISGNVFGSSLGVALNITARGDDLLVTSNIIVASNYLKNVGATGGIYINNLPTNP